ncbi:hypothetical protein [Thermococcus sp.]|uniref:hypothetical protein n=1 Tax=Thermococcus sp. TaxID=35749 RepID=UPI002605E1D3|nr:hypothetical protein [Thermococcus sp.]
MGVVINMGFKDILKKVASSTTRVLDSATTNLEYKKRVDEAKREILSRFTVKQLEQIATTKGIPLYDEDILTGKRTRLRVKSDIVRRLAINLSFQEVIDLSKRYKVRYSDVTQELEEHRRMLYEENQQKRSEKGILANTREIEEDGFVRVNGKGTKTPKKASKTKRLSNTKKDEFVNLLRWIEKNFRPPAVKDEHELQEKLLTLLSAPEIQEKLGIKSIQKEVHIRRRKIDLVINEKWGIELKVIKNKNRTSLDRLPTQINAYKKGLERVAVIAVKPPNEEININEVLELIPSDVPIITMEIPIKRKSRGTTYIAKLVKH